MRHLYILTALLLGFINPAAAQENKYGIDGKHRGLDFSINAGYNAGVGDIRDHLFCLLKLVLASSSIPIYI